MYKIDCMFFSGNRKGHGVRLVRREPGGRPIGAKCSHAIAFYRLKITSTWEKQPLGEIFRRHEQGSGHTIGRTVNSRSSSYPIDSTLGDGLRSVNQRGRIATMLDQTLKIIKGWNAPLIAPFETYHIVILGQHSMQHGRIIIPFFKLIVCHATIVVPVVADLLPFDMRVLGVSLKNYPVSVSEL